MIYNVFSFLNVVSYLYFCVFPTINIVNTDRWSIKAYKIVNHVYTYL